MNIIETKIPDIDIENIDQSKVNFANKVIYNVAPLFNDLRQGKIEEYESSSIKSRQLKKKILASKSNLETLFDQYKRKQKIKKLLERIEKLVSLGIINEGQSKQETVVLLKIVDNLSIEKLNFHLKDTMNTISKRFPTN